MIVQTALYELTLIGATMYQENKSQQEQEQGSGTLMAMLYKEASDLWDTSILGTALLTSRCYKICSI